jgi:formamidopyrimidine-DNA glycosylase
VPELPEVETVRRGLAPLVTGRRVVDAGGHPSPKFRAAVDAVGATVVGVDRRGKYLVLPLDDGRRLIIHLGMTGQLRVDPPPGAADPYDRAWWHLDDGARLALRDVRRFGRVAVIDSDASALPTLAAIGPEPFDPAFTPEVLWANLRRRSVRVKTNLLSQRPVAGVGNIYADEALWRAGIHPAARAISRPAAARLHAALLEVLTAGIEHGGTTLRDYRGVDGSTGSNQLHLACYGRAGQPCPRCGATLRRSVVDGRGTTHCPLCQRR